MKSSLISTAHLKKNLLDPLLNPPLDPVMDSLMDPLLDPILEPLLDAHDFLCNAEQSNMGMLVTRTSSIWGCYNWRHVTKRDVLLLLTIRYLIQ